MLHQLTIPTKVSVEAALDYKQLFTTGLEYVKRLSGRIWTDYNVHDPGITTLELLCYALTDLSYRASFPVKDLLSIKCDFSGVVESVDESARVIEVKGEVMVEVKGQLTKELRTMRFAADDKTKITRAMGDLPFTELRKGMNVSIESKRDGDRTIAAIIHITDIHITERFTARSILPNRPLTLLDYRKLLIDLKGVRNAWLQRSELMYFADTVKGKLLRENPKLAGIEDVRIAGLYDVIIDYEAGSDEISALGDIKRRLHANRNLCEDFVNFMKVDEQYFNLCCEVELSPEADTSKVKAEILFQVQEYLAPTVRNYTLSEMLDRKKPDGSAYTVDEIFDGPTLDYGFIDDAELEKAELREEIRLSDIISIIMDIKGVLAVRDIIVNPTGTITPLEDKWVIGVDTGKKAMLNVDHSRLVFYKRNMPVRENSDQVKALYSERVEAVEKKAETAIPYDLPVPLGTYRNPGEYYSFQNHFPAIYGLSDIGLPHETDDKRQALPYQLKAYLLFCDQVMADYLAQLSHIKELFSTDPQLRHTYFHQVVNSFVDYRRIYQVADGTEEPNHEEIMKLLNDMDDSKLSMDRRNRFLDHLIARFAERFNEFVQIMYSAFGSTPETAAALKCEFLNHYPAISSERALAYNYTLKNDEALWNTDNVSGLEKRLARLLGIRNFMRRNLGDIAYDIYAEVDTTPEDEFRFRVRNRDTGKILLSSSTKYTTPAKAREEMRRAIHAALLPSGYDRRVTTDGKHYFNIVDSTGDIIARRIEYFNTLDDMEHAIQVVMEHLRVNYSDEGMYLIENILLRPEQETDPFLPIPPESGSFDDAGTDPYSYRIHIILPAYASRFENMDFRRFAEEVIREETPAHILPKICWISKEEMAVLEKRYQDWVYLKSRRETASREDKLKDFIDIMFSVRNIYPEEKLCSCASAEDQPKFILGQTALGTMGNNKT